MSGGLAAACFAYLPTSGPELWAWIISLSVAYIVVKTIIRARAGEKLSSDEAAASMWPRTATGFTFGTSVMVLVGLFCPRILMLIGDTKGILALAAVAGIYFGVLALFRKD